MYCTLNAHTCAHSHFIFVQSNQKQSRAEVAKCVYQKSIFISLFTQDWEKKSLCPLFCGDWQWRLNHWLLPTVHRMMWHKNMRAKIHLLHLSNFLHFVTSFGGKNYSEQPHFLCRNAQLMHVRCGPCQFGIFYILRFFRQDILGVLGTCPYQTSFAWCTVIYPISFETCFHCLPSLSVCVQTQRK